MIVLSSGAYLSFHSLVYSSASESDDNFMTIDTNFVLERVDLSRINCFSEGLDSRSRNIFSISRDRLLVLEIQRRPCE